ncbi:hypothetical protein L9F63_013326, partial [Diploptera punctata]
RVTRSNCFSVSAYTKCLIQNCQRIHESRFHSVPTDPLTYFDNSNQDRSITA